MGEQRRDAECNSSTQFLPRRLRRKYLSEKVLRPTIESVVTMLRFAQCAGVRVVDL